VLLQTKAWQATERFPLPSGGWTWGKLAKLAAPRTVGGSATGVGGDRRVDDGVQNWNRRGARRACGVDDAGEWREVRLNGRKKMLM